MTDSSAMTSIEVRTVSAVQTQQLAARLASSLRPGDVVTLEGELGAGKTCFVRGMAEGLGIKASKVSSPTFVIAHEYRGTNHTLTHIDAYRIVGEVDLETIGWSEMLVSKDTIIAIEWPSRIASSLPRSRIEVTIEAISEHERGIRILAPHELNHAITDLSPASSEAGSVRRASLCRTCRKPIASDASAFPFCSDRCRMADLGGWFAGRYSVSRPMQNDDELSD